jgi:hypothetical protein
MRLLATSVLTVLLLVSFLWGLIAWLSPINPHEATFGWGVRIATAAIFPASLVALIAILARPETVPDFLDKLKQPRIGRGGVLFVFDCQARDSWAWIDIHYQNRYTQPAEVTVGIEPSQNFLMTRNEIEPVLVQFECGAAAYGVIQVPIALKQEYQGKSQLFDVAAQIEYPSGMGECLRFVVGPEMSALGFSVLESASIRLARMALSGRPRGVKWQSRAKVNLPQGVADTKEGVPDIVQNERWTLADLPATTSK